MELKPKIEKVSETKRKMSFSVANDVAQKDYRTTIKSFRQYVSMPGFDKVKLLKMIEECIKTR